MVQLCNPSAAVLLCRHRTRRFVSHAAFERVDSLATFILLWDLLMRS